MFPEVVYLEDEEAADNKMAEESEPAAGDLVRDRRDILELGPRVRLGLPVHFKSIHELAQRRMRRANTAFLELRGDGCIVIEPADGVDGAPPEGAASETVVLPSCAAAEFVPVREIFKLGNQYFQRALSHFLLDGWVTEHVRILQELSQMYKTLTFWEEDPKRLAAMLQRRIRMLAPVLELLNPKAYVAFYRQMAFEVGEIHEELYDLKARGRLPGRGAPQVSAQESDDEEGQPTRASLRRAAKLNEVSNGAAKYFGRFVDTYHTDGKVPATIESGHARAYLTARLNRARLRTKTRGLSRDERVEAHKLQLKEYEWMLDYSARHPEVTTDPEIAMEQELHFCKEMVSMLPSKLSRIAAGRRI